MSPLNADSLADRINAIDRRITRWLGDHGIPILRVSLGIIFFWFGFLKFFPSLSPAESLAGETIETISFGLIQPSVAIPILAAWESIIGIGLIVGKALRIIILLLLLQMAGTLLPILIFPDVVFNRIPWAPTMEGQYIFKNLVLISAALVIGATVRGGNSVETEPRTGEPQEPLRRRPRG